MNRKCKEAIGKNADVTCAIADYAKILTECFYWVLLRAKINTISHFMRGSFLYEDALVTLNINLFIHFVDFGSRPLNVHSDSAGEVAERRRCDITEDGLAALHRGPYQNGNVIILKAIMFTFLLLTL